MLECVVPHHYPACILRLRLAWFGDRPFDGGVHANTSQSRLGIVPAPLEGVRVIELTNWMAGPSAAAILADLGADVVKVEPLTGDTARGMSRLPKPGPGIPDVDPSFEADNRGKRSIAVAIDRGEGADLVRRLVATADVFLCNLLPKRQLRFGLDPDTLLALRPALVHATFTGYGATGPDANRPGFDVTSFFGRGSLTDSMTEPGAAPPAPRPAQGDHTSSLALVAGVLAALRLVERTGQGQVLDCSLLATAAWTQTTELSVTLVDGHQPSKRDRRHIISALANRFRCKDDRWIVLNMTETRFWPIFCATVEHSEWISDSRFDTAKARADHMPELTDLLDDALATRSLAEWGPVFDAAGLIWGPAATLRELATDPQAEAIGMYPYIEHPKGRFRTVAAPLFIRGADIGPRGPAPELGAHTSDVLTDLGLDPSEIAALATAHVVGIKP